MLREIHPAGTVALADQRQTGRWRQKESMQWVGLALVVGLALAWRLWAHERIPGGLHYDEAADGLIGKSVLDGRWRVFYPEFTGKEPFYMWLLALGEWVWGQNAEGVRLPAAFVGAATVGAAWWTARAIFTPVYGAARGVRLAWLAALSLGVSYWHFHLSRLGYRAILLPLVELLAFAALWTAISSRKRSWWIVAGLLNAAVLYTYLSARFVPMVLVAFGLYLVLFHRPALRAYARERRVALLSGGAAFVAGVAPLALYFTVNRREFFERTGQISIFQPLGAAPGKLWNGFVQSFQMISIAGSDDLKYTSPGRALFDWPLALFFYLGLALTLYQWKQPRPAFLLLWLGLMLLPAILSTEGNQPLRIGGAVPAFFVIWAVGFEAVWRWLAARLSWGWWGGLALATALLGFAAYSTHTEYFDRWGQRADLYYAFDQDYADFAHLTVRWSREHPRTVPVVVSESVQHPTMIYLEPSLEKGRWLDLNQSLILPREVFEQNPPPAVEYIGAVRYLGQFKLKAVWQEWLGKDQAAVLPQAAYGGPGGAIYRYSPKRTLTVQSLPMDVRTCGPVSFDQNITLLGYRTRQEGRTVSLDLFWQAQRATADDFRMYVHLVDRAGSSNLLGIGDANGAYSQAWRTGDVIIGHHEIKLDERATLPGRYLVEVGLYNTASLKRMSLVATSASPAPDPACTIQPDPANNQVLLTNFTLK